MITYFFLMAAVVFFVWGFILIIKGWHGFADDDIVALADLDKIREFDTEYNPGEFPAVKSASGQGGTTKSSDGKPGEALLAEENARLKGQIEEQENKLSELQRRCEDLQGEGNKIQAFEQKLKAIQEEKVQLLLSKELVDDLKFKNRHLQEREKENSLKIDQMSQELSNARQELRQYQETGNQSISELKKENQELLGKMQEKDGLIQRFRADLEMIHKTNNQRLNEANRIIDLMRVQRKESDRIQEEILNKQLSKAMAEAEGLKMEREELLHAKAALEQNFQKIKEFNAHLLEKEKILQYELTKQRAQALGLERICEDFKIQIDKGHGSSYSVK